jgi:hypothetical protein
MTMQTFVNLPVMDLTKGPIARWEICHDGETWEHDFDRTYTRA